MIVMRSLFLVLSVALALGGTLRAQTGFPFQNESLRYSVNWPSGLSLGESTMSAQRYGDGWNFEMGVEAGIPGFTVSDKFTASATADLCSTEMQRNISHGSRKTGEKIEFKQGEGMAHRTTLFPSGGGASDLKIASCAKDALTFLYYTRKELGQGRVPPVQQIYFGPAYSVRLEWTGAQNITTDQHAPEVTDRVTVSVKGPKSDLSFEAFFARDAARTPLRVRVPFAVGTVSMELVR